MARKKVNYDESTIQTLEALEHIRLRPGMYIGRVGDGTHPNDGVYILLKEVVDNAVDEFIMGEGRRIDVSIDDEGIAVRDFGRGIPLGKVIDCVSKINTGGKYNDDVFQFSVGLNGIGTKAVNALSERFEVTSWREGKFRHASFERGELKRDQKGKQGDERQGTLVRFTPDPEIFGRYKLKEEFLEHRFRYYSYLNPGLTLNWNGQRFKSSEGLRDLLDAELGEVEPLYPIIHARLDKLEFAFTHTQAYGETTFSFVNGQFTNDGGTHLSAFREAVLKAINEFAGRSFTGPDVRDGMIGAIAIKLQDPVFESQTKNKLGSTEVRPEILQAVREEVILQLHRQEATAKKLLEKVQANERLRRELASIKKQARERAKKVAIRIPKLTDCKLHRGDKHKRALESSIFLTEGDSAGGSMIQARDVDTQAVFTLKGKPLNTHGLKREAIYKNEELYNMMRALGIEDSIDDLRYERVVIATDADVDGMHIRNLLLTYFLRFFEELVSRGHLYILETPLFRVRNRKATRYAYSEEERQAAISALERPEVTRFKGLGEISPSELKAFIRGEEIRLIPVQVRSMAEVQGALDFYMGKNTPERRGFIVDNLITDIA